MGVCGSKSYSQQARQQAQSYAQRSASVWNGLMRTYGGGTHTYNASTNTHSWKIGGGNHGGFQPTSRGSRW